LTNTCVAFERRRRTPTEGIGAVTVHLWKGIAEREIGPEVSALIAAVAALDEAAAPKRMPMRQTDAKQLRSVSETTANPPWRRIYYPLTVAVYPLHLAVSASGSVTETERGRETETGITIAPPALAVTMTRIMIASDEIERRSESDSTVGVLTAAPLRNSHMVTSDPQDQALDAVEQKMKMTTLVEIREIPRYGKHPFVNMLKKKNLLVANCL
jgi:hypothetical protein